MIISEQISSTRIEYQKLTLQLPSFKQIQSDFILENNNEYLYIHPLTQLHCIGTLTCFYYKNEKFFIGTKEGQLYIKENQKQKIISIKKQENGLVTSLLNKVTPFKSELKNKKKKTTLSDLISLPYFIQKPKKIEYDNTIISICLSQDDKLLLIGIQQGEIHIYHYSSLSLLEILDFCSPQIFMIFYFQSSDQGLIKTIEKQIHKTYELICSDKEGNLNKLCFNIFKLMNNRTLKYDHQILLEQQKECEEDISLLYDIKLFEIKNNNAKFILLWKNRIELINIKYGKQNDAEIISVINRQSLDYIYQNYFSQDFEIIQICNKNQVCFGSGIVSMFNKEKNQIQQYKQQFILYNYGPLLILCDKYLKPLKIGIITLPKQIINIESDIKIIFITFISDNIILIHFSQNQSILLNLKDFGVDFEYFENIIKIKDKILLSQSINKLQICGQIIYQLNNFNNKFNFYYKESTNNQIYILYLDNTCSVSEFMLNDWQAYLQVLFDKHKYMQGLSECYKLMIGKTNILANIPISQLNNQVNNYVKQFAKGFCENIKLFDNKEVEKQIIYVLEFLLTTNNEDIIFTDLRDVLKYQNKVQILYKYSEEYQIDFIPSQILQEMEQEFEKEKLYKILCGFNPKLVQFEEIAYILLKNQYYELLIHFCINKNYFVTPINKLCNLDISITYILMMFQGNNVTNSKLVTQNHQLAVKQILNYLLNNQNILQQLLILDKQLNIGLMCFHHKTIKAIQQIEDEIEINTFIINNQGLEKCNSIFDKILIIFTTQYLQLLEKQHPQQNLKYLYFFQSEAILSRLVIMKKEIHMKLIKYFILHYEELTIQNLNIFFLNHFQIYFQTQIYMEDVNQLLSLLGQEIKIKTLAYCFLMDLIGQYQQCLELWINIQDFSLKQQIFSWIQGILQKKIERHISINQLVLYFQYLMNIDPKQTYEIISQYYKDLQPIFINSIQDEKQAISYIKYMQIILEDHILLNEQTKLRYIKYLCQYQKKIVKKILVQYNFPLKESLQLCIEFHHIGASIQIYILLGDYRSATELMSQKLVGKIKLCTRTIIKTKTIGEQEKEKVKNQLKKIQQLIINNGNEYQEMNNLWLIVLDRFFKDNPLKNLTAKSLPSILKELLIHVTLFLLQNMLLSMNFYDFLQIIIIKYPEMSASIFSKVIEAIKDLSYQQGQFYYYGQVFYFNEKQLFLEKIKSFVEKGIKVNALNCNCNNNDPLTIIYKCGHVFHLSCLPNNTSRCWICHNSLKDQICKIPIQKITINQKQIFERKTKEYFQKFDKLRKYENRQILELQQKNQCWEIN